MHSSISVHHLANGCSEFHVVFDNPGRQPNSPKLFERKRRDDTASLSSDHKHVTFSDACPVPSKWRDCLACRVCKRALVLYLGQSFKQFVVSTCRLREHQKVILAGCFSGVYQMNTVHWTYSNVSVCFLGQEHHSLSLDSLRRSLEGDPDLSTIPRELLPKVLQTLFICTGCDYVSYFAGIGKSTFLKVFFQHASFINIVCQGTLASTCDTSCELGFLSFVRLIGTVYSKKYVS